MKFKTYGNNQVNIVPSYVLGSDSKDYKHYIFKEIYEQRLKQWDNEKKRTN
tara:strand:+ start:172 stop:324 length:153 start_codon:yes stop_codon:yes gene_type:complete